MFLTIVGEYASASRTSFVEAIVRKILKSVFKIYMDLERSNAFRQLFKALKELLLIVDIWIYICATGRFQRRFYLQITINFVYEIRIHFKASCKGSEKLSS